MEEIPNELLELFFTFLDVKSLSLSSTVCRKWNLIIASNEALWGRLTLAFLKRNGILLLPSVPPASGLVEQGLIERIFEGQSSIFRSDASSTEEDAHQRLRGMKKVVSTRLKYAETIAIVIEGTTERQAVLQALLRVSKEEGYAIANSFPARVLVFYQGLLYLLLFKPLSQWLAENTVYSETPEESVFVVTFSLDKSEQEAKKTFEWTALALSKVMPMKDGLPIFLLGLKETENSEFWFDEVDEGKDENVRRTNKHFLFSMVENLPGREKNSVYEEEGTKEKFTNEESPLLDLEAGDCRHAEEKGKEKQTEEEERDAERDWTEEDRIRKAAISVAHTLQRCDGYLEMGWNEKKRQEIDQPVELLAALLEGRKKVKEATLTPYTYAIGRERLAKRQQSSRGHLWSILHGLEGILCILLLPFLGLAALPLCFFLGTYYILLMAAYFLLPCFFSSSYSSSSSSCPCWIRPFFFLLGLPFMIGWLILITFSVLLAILVLPLVGVVQACTYGYRYGFYGTSRIGIGALVPFCKELLKPVKELITELDDTRSFFRILTLTKIFVPYLAISTAGLVSILPVEWFV